MAKRTIDVKVLIKEIFLRPQIWDPKQKMLTDKKTRKRTWEDLCTVFDEHYHERSTDKQIEMCQYFKRKFRTLRESYLREEKLQIYEKKCGKSKSKRRQYVYFDQLHFLSTNSPGGKSPLKKRLMRNNLKTATQSLNEEERAEDEQILSTVDTSPQANELDKSLPTVQSTSCHVHNITAQMPPPLSIDLDFTEPDTLFLLSLVNEMKKVTEDNKLPAKIDILQAIRRWQTSNECQSTTNQNVDSISTVFSNFQEQEIHVFYCPICQNKFRTKNAQQNHLESHVENGLYICSQCFIGFISIKELMFHMKSHNQKTQNHSDMFKQNCVSMNGTVDSLDDAHKTEFIKLEYSDSDTNQSLR